MLLSTPLRKTISIVLSFCSFWRIIPYDWDPQNFRLMKAPVYGLRIHKLHFWISIIMLSFSSFRLLWTIHVDIPERLRLLNVLWCVGHVIQLICFLQFRIRMDEIRQFTNFVFSHVHQLQEFAEYPSRKWEKYITIHVLIYMFVMAINPPFHSIMVLDAPCSQQFTSSLYFPCRNYLDNALNSDDVSFWKNLLIFFPIETYFVCAMFFVWGFNFLVAVHAVVWLKSELENLRKSEYNRGISSKYRNLQLYVNCFNDSFKLYMEWYPLIIISIVAMLIFGIIRYWGADWRAYTMFPACAIRCFLEVGTPTALAGKSNSEAQNFLREMKQKFQIKKGYAQAVCPQGYNKQWIKAFQKSCPTLAVRAGALYELENTIVLTYLDNCVKMTLDMLLFSRNRAGKTVSFLP